MAKSKKGKKASFVKVEEPLWSVEVITEARRTVSPEDIKTESKDAKKKAAQPKKVVPSWEYLVEWTGYDSDGKRYLPTWEPQENLRQCKRLLNSFWKHVGEEKREYEIGFVVKAETDWIETEKKLSKKRLEREQEMSAEPDSDSSDDDNKPLEPSSSPLKIIIRKRKASVETVETVELEPVPASVNAWQANGGQKRIKTSESPSKASAPAGAAPLSPARPLPNITPQGTPVAIAPFTPPQAQVPPPTVPGTGISTKARLAPAALELTLPKDGGKVIRSPSKQVPSTQTPKRKPRYANLKVPKIPQAVPVPSSHAHSPTLDEPILASLNSLSIQSPPKKIGTFERTVNPGPTPSISAIDHTIIHSNPFEDETISPALISPPSPMADAEAFLRDILPPNLSVPLVPTLDQPLEVVHPTVSYPKLPTPGRLPKMWKWSGPIHFTSQKNSLCNVKVYHLIKDQTKFSSFFKQIDKIEVGTFYDNVDIRTNLGVFRTPPQLALLGPEEKKDQAHFNVLSCYLEKNQKIFMIPMLLDDNVIGQLLFFPYIFHFQVLGQDVPLEFNQPGNLVTAILPYTLSPRHLKCNSPLQNIETVSMEPTLETIQWEKSLKKQPKYQHGLRLLGLGPSHKLYDFLAGHHQARICVWSEKDSKQNHHMETSLLLGFLEQMQACLVAPTANARIVFTHIGLVGKLHKFPSFAKICSQSPSIQFYTYGTHQDVAPSLWGVQEIYPYGGIVTFTPSAMYTDPVTVLHIIRQINAHPQWVCYILPSALGMLARLECGPNEDLLNVSESQMLVVDSILEAITEGEVALLHAPLQKAGRSSSLKDPHVEWINQYLSILPPHKLAALQAGITAFLANQKLSESDDIQQQTIAMNNVIVADMSLMQQQPVLLKAYRRFVVIDVEGEVAKQPPYIQGLEWTSIAEFDFKDEFYPKQSVGLGGK